jgi:hypothetical protein
MSQIFQKHESDYCNKCQKTSSISLDYYCGHCLRKFCYSCKEVEIQHTKYEGYSHRLPQCSYCINCKQEDFKLSLKYILNSPYEESCPKCCVSECVYQRLSEQILKKRKILDLVKIKIQEDMKNTIDKINSKIQFLDTYISEIPENTKKRKYTKDFSEDYYLKADYDDYIRRLESIN